MSVKNPREDGLVMHMCSHQITLRHFARRSFEDKLNFLRVITKTIATTEHLFIKSFLTFRWFVMALTLWSMVMLLCS